MRFCTTMRFQAIQSASVKILCRSTEANQCAATCEAPSRKFPARMRDGEILEPITNVIPDYWDVA